MADGDLILGVLAVQAGFVTPGQVMAAASQRVVARDGRSLLDHLVEAGALTPARRELVAMLAAEEADGASISSGRHPGGLFPSRQIRPLDRARAAACLLRRALGEGGLQLRGVEIEAVTQ